MQKYNVAVVTGTRAEYGLLRRVIKQMLQNSNLNVQLIVTGAHLSNNFGNTVKEIENDNIEIFAKIPILKYTTNTPYATTKTMAYAMMQFTEHFNSNKPDALMVLGDRYEILAACLAASGLLIPVIHISGGDVTHGAQDDYYRHCITKTAQLHFPSCKEYAQRVIQLGEAPSTVHNVGGLGDENIRKLQLLSKEDLAKSINYNVESKYFLITYHPQTAGESRQPAQKFNNLLQALLNFNIGCIFTKANADAGGTEINELIDIACKKHNNYISFDSMGGVRYLSAMKYCTAVIGNSSSGVVETPTMRVPAVNIGTRQSGRIISGNVICCNDDVDSIKKSIEQAMSLQFAKKSKQTVSPYDGGNTAEKIVDITVEFLKNYDETRVKTFWDI